MSSTLLYLLGMFTVAFGGPADPCQAPNPAISLPELDKTAWYLQLYIPKSDTYVPKCAKYTFAVDQNTKIGTVAYTAVDFNTGTPFPISISNMTQSAEGYIECVVVNQPGFPTTKLTALYRDEQGGAVVKQSFEKNGDKYENIAVVTSEQIVSNEKVAELLNKACVTDLTKSQIVSQQGCS